MSKPRLFILFVVIAIIGSGCAIDTIRANNAHAEDGVTNEDAFIFLPAIQKSGPTPTPSSTPTNTLTPTNTPTSTPLPTNQLRLYNDQSQGAVHKPMGKGPNTLV